MDQHILQDEIRRIIISDMMKKRSFIVPIIGEDLVYFFGVLLAFLSSSDGALKWILCTFEESLKMYSISTW